MEKNKSIKSVPKDLCTGCKMCGDICPNHSISFTEDEEGFFYPLINKDTCIDCGLCSKKCPALNSNVIWKTDYAYSAFAADKSQKDSGSSGGIFSLLANFTINNGGIVYGAAFDESLKLRHHRIEKNENIRPLCKSKYLQSDCSNIYSLVKEDLKIGKQVLFVGTPCQVNALLNFTGNKLRENLTLVDFICHGVPSQKLFDENIKWNTKKYGKVKKIEFRYKGKRVLHPHTLNITYKKNGKERNILRMHYQDPFYFGFQKHITLRPSCYQCKWAKPERCSDITLSDFWGIEKAKLGLDSKKGVSCLLLNTKKGNNLFKQIKDKIEGIHLLPIDFAAKNNECMCNSTKRPQNRDSFFYDWQHLGYEYVVKKYLTPKNKWMFDIYYAIPGPIRKIVRMIMENKIKYE